MASSEERLKMAIPSWPGLGQFIFCAVLAAILVLATLVAVFSILLQVQFVIPCIWLAFVALVIGIYRQNEGSFRNCLIDFLGSFSARHFVERITQDGGLIAIQLGYELFSRRFLYFRVPLDRIQEVHWSPGQNPTFWVVFLWYHWDSLEENMERPVVPNSNRGIFCVGPSRRQEKTVALGLAFVEFLRRAGVPLVQGKDRYTFVRAQSATIDDENHVGY